MTGFCSICNEGKKVHEDFELLVDEIILCWECGTTILNYVEKELNNGGKLQ